MDVLAIGATEEIMKFTGKNVLVTGVLDGRTDMIQVREITEAKA